MSARPKIKVPLTPTDKVFETIGWFTVAALWFLILWKYSSLPETIPTHFNGAGRPDGYGGKGTLLMLPVIGTVLFVSMTILNRFPQIFNYPTNITVENAARQYANATRMMRFLKFAIVLVFSIIVFQTIRTVEGKSKGLGGWFLPVVLGLVLIPTVFFIINSFRKEKV